MVLAEAEVAQAHVVGVEYLVMVAAAAVIAEHPVHQAEYDLELAGAPELVNLDKVKQHLAISLEGLCALVEGFPPLIVKLQALDGTHQHEHLAGTVCQEQSHAGPHFERHTKRAVGATTLHQWHFGAKLPKAGILMTLNWFSGV